MPSDPKTRLLVSKLLKHSTYYIGIYIFGLIFTYFILSPYFFQTAETAWLILIAIFYVNKSINKAVKAKTRNMIWAFIFKPFTQGISAIAFIAVYVLSIGEFSVFFGNFNDPKLLFVTLSVFFMLIILGYIGVSAFIAAVIRTTGLKTAILTKAFAILTIVFAISMGVATIVPWINDISFYIFYLLIISLYGTILNNQIPTKFVDYIIQNKIEKASVADYMNFLYE